MKQARVVYILHHIGPASASRMSTYAPDAYESNIANQARRLCELGYLNREKQDYRGRPYEYEIAPAPEQWESLEVSL